MTPSSNQLSFIIPSPSPSPESPPPSCAVPAQKGTLHKRKAGRKKFQETRHPVYKGVRRRNGKWVCELRQPLTNRRIWLGTFPCPEMAARAHDVAVWALKGESASLNFPEVAHSLPRAKSASIKDIQIAALELFSTDDLYKSTNTNDTTCDDSEGEMFKIEEGSARRKLLVDEDELFNMPALIDSMAEGLILTPPALKRGFSWCGYMENDAYMDLTLWTAD